MPIQASGWLSEAAIMCATSNRPESNLTFNGQVRSNPGRSLLIAGATGWRLGIC